MNMDDSSASYIHMVHHLIEECLIFNMSKEECMEALSKHAIWNELEKENKEFFEAYTRNRDQRATDMEKRQRIQFRVNAYMREKGNKD
ncbi:hypothetical protein E1A91_D04G138600v1 [Gossypium mustelinum]|uniref:Uncharacterized protein n=1 Tax=Gossypium mustelinum TaxID=34275 RepID=A0A5D2VDN8_GOSMU|nr:hypothetical protein E1A91_D04G138600v1 [Gossypium mustelinum]